MSTFTPQAFGKYFLVDKIATGGMAEIFKAKTYSHGGFENLLVIKRILPHIGENEDFIEMFIDEAKVSVALQHPNIVRIYDFGKILDNYFIAMECVDGKDSRNVLRKLARRKQYLPPKYCAFIAHEVCKGLHYAHQKKDLQGNPFGIVHRDISPSNVLVSYDGECKIADFGIAKAESNAYQTRDGVLKGKFEYMSPEQALGREIDHRSDLFSLGIILYETLTGRRLFKTDSEVSTLKKIREADFDPPTRVKPDIPPALEAIVLKALQREPDDRYQTAAEMADDLREFLFPATPDQLREELQHFMHDVFSEEIEQERARLESGSSLAQQLREKLPPDAWDGHTDSTMSSITQTTVKYVVPWMAGLALLLVGLVVLVVGGGLYVYSGGLDQPKESLAKEAPAPTTGTLDVMVLPSARILVNGEVKGEGESVTLEELPPGDYLVRLEAEGRVPVEETVTVVAGQQARFQKTLAPVPGSEEPEEVEEEEPVRSPGPRPTPSGPPRVSFRSSPPGAQVIVDGDAVGVTPFTWRGGAPGARYRVEMRLDGYDAAGGTLSGLRKGGSESFSLTLQRATSPGKLTVTLVGPGWANVYVDGEKLSKTAPLANVELSVGSHEIRVENTTLGIDQTETVNVGSGETVTIRARPQ